MGNLPTKWIAEVSIGRSNRAGEERAAALNGLNGEPSMTDLRIARGRNSFFDVRYGGGIDLDCQIAQPFCLVQVAEDLHGALEVIVLPAADKAGVCQEVIFPKERVAFIYEGVVPLERHLDKYFHGRALFLQA
jgi:hypothetical protein